MQYGVIREALLEVLIEIGSNVRQMHNVDCFKALGDLLMFVLTYLEHEELTDNRLLYTILFSSSHLYVIPL
jgi:hypothetical protein